MLQLGEHNPTEFRLFLLTVMSRSEQRVATAYLMMGADFSFDRAFVPGAEQEEARQDVSTTLIEAEDMSALMCAQEIRLCLRLPRPFLLSSHQGDSASAAHAVRH